VHEIISLDRFRALAAVSRALKTIVRSALADRFAAVHRTPDKRGELRMTRGGDRIAERACAALDGLADLKLPARPRRRGKLRLFRSWKLLEPLKSLPVAPRDYAAIADRLRSARWRRRL
jgi:hypothetical protein